MAIPNMTLSVRERINRMKVVKIATILSWVVASGCDISRNNLELPGVDQVKESTTPLWQREVAWQVSTAPRLDIGGGGTAEQQLFQVKGSIRQSDGRIVIANAGSAQLLFYSPEGQFLGSAGRDGSGPGEFAINYGPASAWRMDGDSVAAWDPDTRRLSVFDTRGIYARSRTFGASGGQLVNPIGLIDHRSIVTAQYSGEERMDVPLWEAYRSTVRYDVYSYEGEQLAHLAEVPHWEMLVSDFNGQRISTPRPFARISQVAVGSQGIYYTSADAFEIFHITFAADSTVVLRVLQEPHGVSASDIAAYEAQRMASAPGDPSGRQAWERWFTRVTYPETFPTFSGLTVDELGNLWAHRYARQSDSTSESWVFDPTGVWLGAVEVPKDFTPHDIGDTYVLGMWEDASGVEHVQLYDLMKPR